MTTCVWCLGENSGTFVLCAACEQRAQKQRLEAGLPLRTNAVQAVAEEPDD